MTIETILLAVGPTDERRTGALAEAVAEIAVPTGAQVVLAHVFTEDEFTSTRGRLATGSESPAELSPDQVAERHTSIRNIAASLDDAGVEYEIRGAVGDHGEAVVELAETVGADRVVVGGRRRSPAGKAVFGSTAQEILLSAPCPVTFVRTD